MLLELTVEDFAIIERIQLTFKPGFNVLTGETGAGKSLLVDAIGLALGERADTEFIRTGASKSVVTALFDIDNKPELLPPLAELGIDIEDGLLILTREISTGKSISRINGRPVPLASLKKLGDILVDLHGQHEHQSLLYPERHLGFLDAWIGENARSLRKEVSAQYSELNKLIKEFEALQEQSRERERNLDIYRFQIQEIEEAKLVDFNEEEILLEQARLANAEKLFASSTEVYEELTKSEVGGYDCVAKAAVKLKEAAAIDATLMPMLELLENAYLQIDEAIKSLRIYTEEIEFNPSKIEEISDRMDIIHKLKRKYGGTIESIIEAFDEMKEQLNILENFEERSHQLEADIAALNSKLEATCRILTELRSKKAMEFGAEVETHLRPLAMEKSKFFVQINSKPIDSTGADKVEFFISPNVGDPLRPLAKIASGGEISRVMLAIKTVLADGAGIPTLVFDEVDTGLGGRAAAVVGRKMSDLSKFVQVLSITHLPQIASRADTHIRLEKREVKGRTQVCAVPIVGEERIEEIARMIGGETLTTSALQHAKEMLVV